MWKTITAKENSIVRLFNSTFKDAENVVTALDGSTVVLKESQFVDNRTTLYIPAVPGVPQNDVAVSVIGNTFHSSGTLAQPYPGQTTAVGSVGYAAVDANKAVVDLTGGGNVIDGMGMGIVGNNCNLDVEGFTFRNIQPDAAYGTSAGIYLKGQNSILDQLGFGQNGSPSFEDCALGIVTEFANVKSRNNKMVDVGVGYRVSNSANRTVELSANYIDADYHGMDLRMNGGATQFLVQDNTIDFGNVNGGPYPYCFGIVVNEAQEPNNDSRIVDNTILFNAKQASRVGIGLLSAGKWLVAGNTLTMASNSFNWYGIANNGSRTPEISCNTITGASSTSFPNENQAAILSNMGIAPKVSCNVVDNTANGLLFNGAATGNPLVRGNEFHRHKWGLHLSANALIGTQERKGNLWFDPPAAGGWGAWYENIQNAQLFKFMYNPATINGGSTEPPSWEPIQWFQLAPGANFACSNGQGVDYCSQFAAAQAGQEGITDLDEQIAADSLGNDPYTEESRWMLSGGLYQKLDDDPALLDSLPDMADFHLELQGSTIAAFKAIGDDRSALYHMDSTVVTQLQANRVQIEVHMNQVKDEMALLDDTTLTAAERNAVIAGMDGYRQNIQTLTTWNSTALDAARASKVQNADSAGSANDGIGTTELIEANQKAVNKLYLAVIAKEVEGFTTDQTNTLFAIANQCPMVGGNAVYQARSLYRTIDDGYAFDDPLLCLPHGIIVKSTIAEDASAIGIVPDPAWDEATLVLEEPLEEPGTLVLYNALGKEVMRMAVSPDQPRTSFGIGRLSPGMYHYRVVTSTGLAGLGKWSVVRNASGK
ncbi:MAG: hypothetical protein IT230_05480 [Flavobacteriales bacterium]|nr:hypothetical protein [Flavobacteriales bacterium]